MEDVDMDDLIDAPKPSTNRPSRFAPKGSKFKPKPKTEPTQSVPTSEPNSVDSLPVPKNEESGSSSSVRPELTNGATEMDVDVKPELKEEKDNSMETEAEETAIDIEDEIVREIDVYFTPSVDPKTRLYVLQYPLRPLWRPYDLDERCEEVRVKPNSAEVEVDLTVDVDSKNYDTNADPRVQMKKQTLTSSWKPPCTSGYAVGVLNGDKLHLNPIHSVVQLRPSMKHLDYRESKRKSSQPSNVENAVKLEESHEVKPSLKKQSKIPEQNKDGGEAWIPLKYHSLRTDMASRYLQKLFAQEGSEINFSISSLDYLDSLCPGISSDSVKPMGLPRRFLLTLPLRERIRTWLLEGPPVHRFDVLKYLAPDESVEEVLAVLQEYARLVQGLWFPKSSLVYGTDEGIEVLARDYILVLFSKNLIINNSQLPSLPKLAKVMKDVLNVLAVERHAFNDWKLRELPDMNFIKLYPGVVMKQEAEWESMGKKINDLFGGKMATNAKGSAKSNNTTNSAASRGSNKVGSRNPNGASISAMSEGVREAVMKALQKLFKNVKVCSFQQIGQLLRDMAVSERTTGLGKQAVAAANSIDAYPDEFQAIVNQVAANVHGICIPRSSPEHPQYDSFRKVVIDLFLAEGPNAKLKKATILEAAKMELQREIPNNEYLKVVNELCSSQGGLWILNSGGDGNPKH